MRLTGFALICTLLLAMGCVSNPVSIDSRLSPGQILDDELLQKTLHKEIGETWKRNESRRAIDVEVYNGYVYLFGTVQDSSERELAVNIAKDHRHVRGIHSELLIDPDWVPGVGANDRRIALQARLALANNKLTRNSDLTIHTHRETVYLTGMETRSLIGDAAKSIGKVPGVAKVVLLTEYLD